MNEQSSSQTGSNVVVSAIKVIAPRQTPVPKTVPAKRLSDDDRIANLKVLVETSALSQEEFEEEVNRIKSK